jgi:hypothetical protein
LCLLIHSKIIFKKSRRLKCPRIFSRCLSKILADQIQKTRHPGNRKQA